MSKIKQGREVPVIMVLFFLFVLVSIAAAENVNRSTEYISPFGNYKGLQATKTLTTGIQATAAGTPANAAQSTVAINGDMNVTQGNVNIDEIFEANGGTFETYPSSIWLGTHWFGINVDPATLVPSTGTPRVECEVNGDIYAKYFRASPGNNDSDQLLYFGVTNDGSWVEMGSMIGFMSGWGVHGGFSRPESAARFNASPKIVLNFYSGGNVGIGTANPQYKLQVGDPPLPGNPSLYALAYSWDVFSSRQYKTDISVFESHDIQRVFSEIAKLNVVRFHYKGDKPEDRLRMGVIAEEAPKEVLSANETTLSMTDTIGFLVAGIQALKTENDVLEKEIGALEQGIAVLEKKRGLS